MLKIFLLIILIFSALACDDTITVTDLDNKIIPSSNVSFSQDIYPVLQAKCAYSGCHSGTSPAGNIDLTSWVNVTSTNIITIGDPDLSRLVWAINGTPAISPMPPPYTGLALTPNQVQGIITWIKEGAKQN